MRSGPRILASAQHSPAASYKPTRWSIASSSHVPTCCTHCADLTGCARSVDDTPCFSVGASFVLGSTTGTSTATSTGSVSATHGGSRTVCVGASLAASSATGLGLCLASHSFFTRPSVARETLRPICSHVPSTVPPCSNEVSTFFRSCAVSALPTRPPRLRVVTAPVPSRSTNRRSRRIISVETPNAFAM
jgi:hypothetical protein